MAKAVTKKSAPKTAVRKYKRKGTESWKTYIFRVLKQVHPETRISQKGMAIINNFVTDTFEKVVLAPNYTNIETEIPGNLDASQKTMRMKNIKGTSPAHRLQSVIDKSCRQANPFSHQAVCRMLFAYLLEAARSRRPPLPEIVLWIAASRSPSESQTSECSDLLSRSRATLVIVAQRQPGKLQSPSGAPRRFFL